MKVSGEIRGSIYESVLYRRSDGKCGLIFAQDSGGQNKHCPYKGKKKCERRKGVIAKSASNIEPSSRKFASEGGSVSTKECEGRAIGIVKIEEK